MKWLIIIVGPLLAVVLMWNPASAGTWPPVPSDCQYRQGEVLLSGDAFNSVHCNDEQIKNVIRCFHYPYEANGAVTLRSLVSQIESYMLLHDNGLPKVAELLRYTSPSVLACKVNDTIWIESDWRTL